MEFIDIPTEQTTAVTDAILSVLAIAFALYLRRIGQSDRKKINLWICLFVILAFAATVGTIVHGFKMSKMLHTLLWHPIYLSLGLLVALFVAAVIYDVWGEAMFRRWLPIMITVGVCFFCIILVWSAVFWVFVFLSTRYIYIVLFG